MHAQQLQTHRLTLIYLQAQGRTVCGRHQAFLGPGSRRIRARTAERGAALHHRGDQLSGAHLHGQLAHCLEKATGDCFVVVCLPNLLYAVLPACLCCSFDHGVCLQAAGAMCANKLSCREQVYAYTTSTVMRGVLDLFVRCETVLPNLYIGTLTRDTVTSALARGLAADDLINFLEAHAHPRAAQRKLAVPEVSLCCVQLA